MTRNGRPSEEKRPTEGPGEGSTEGYSTPVKLFDDGQESTPIVQCARCGGRIFGPDQQAGDRHRWCVERDAGAWSPPTSHTAAKQASTGTSSRVAQIVLAAIYNAGSRGKTDDELAHEFPDEHAGSLSKRRLDLVRAGLIYDSGRTRPTSRGVEAIVWVSGE